LSEENGIHITLKQLVIGATALIVGLIVAIIILLATSHGSSSSSAGILPTQSGTSGVGVGSDGQYTDPQGASCDPGHVANGYCPQSPVGYQTFTTAPGVQP